MVGEGRPQSVRFVSPARAGEPSGRRGEELTAANRLSRGDVPDPVYLEPGPSVGPDKCASSCLVRPRMFATRSCKQGKRQNGRLGRTAADY
jgi:hypothetical protein